MAISDSSSREPRCCDSRQARQFPKKCPAAERLIRKRLSANDLRRDRTVVFNGSLKCGLYVPRRPLRDVPQKTYATAARFSSDGCDRPDQKLQLRADRPGCVPQVVVFGERRRHAWRCPCRTARIPTQRHLNGPCHCAVRSRHGSDRWNGCLSSAQPSNGWYLSRLPPNDGKYKMNHDRTGNPAIRLGLIARAMIMAVTEYIWDEDNLVAETDGTNAVNVVYTNEPQQYGNLISTRIAGTTSYHHFDALGSTRQLTNSAGCGVSLASGGRRAGRVHAASSSAARGRTRLQSVHGAANSRKEKP